ncbi:NADH dehydrogenase [Amycolatopsis pretoriensis]|uniref:NADH dehydrogenase n=1 Tax=Amycolatopsis pretoriensis TaxID=218821 RepID=A0A1H5Q3K5_9PSEU|nr:hypothetical protein [Amycolatopsis pretoriensis]SEF20656.1 NADH dehydrogenase [Amycolatopsis pretoriensis]
MPNAQHAVRQDKLLARTIAASLRGRTPKNYRHRSLGAVATLGIVQYRRLVLKGRSPGCSTAVTTCWRSG